MIKTILYTALISASLAHMATRYICNKQANEFAQMIAYSLPDCKFEGDSACYNDDSSAYGKHFVIGNKAYFFN